MSELGDLLELLHRARDRWRTVRATIRVWRHNERSEAAWQAWADQSTSAVTHFGTAEGPPQPETSESLTRLWIDGDRVREEHEGEYPHLGIRRGKLWWIYDEVNGAVSNEDNPDHGSSVGERFRRLFDPSRISGGVRFELLGRTTAGGRDGIRVRLIPRRTDNPHRDLDVPFGADDHELVVDAERGVLLRVASRIGGEDFYVEEMLDVAFDELLPDELFVFELPEGETIRSAAARFSMRDCSIEEAQREASFTVWIPGRLDPGWEMRVHYLPGEERPPSPESVSVHYWRQDASHQFALHETAAGEQDPWAGDWEPSERNVEELLVATHPQARVRVERDGTQVIIHSETLDLERLLELVDILVPAPSEPPPLAAS